MTEKEEQTPKNNTENTDADSETSTNLSADDLDIEGALASIASLNELASEQEDDVDEDVDDEAVPTEDDMLDESDIVDIQEFERVDDDNVDNVDEVLDDDDTDYSITPPADDDAVVQPADAPSSFETSFPHPPMSVLHRGQLASVVPAIVLIGIGAYLTFLVTVSEASIQPVFIVAMAVGGLGIILIAQWLSSARWSIGSFFIGNLLLLVGATTAYLSFPNNLSLTDGWALIITAIGTAFVITDVFIASGRRIWLIGLLLAVVGLIGVVTTTTVINMSIADRLGSLLPVALILLILLLIAPIIRRQQ